MSRPRATVGASLRTLAFLILVTSIVGACVPVGERPEFVDDAATDLPGGTLDCPAPVSPFEAFTTTVVRVIGSAGELPRCVLVADTSALRSQGLMQVSDLAGYDGMIFAFAGDEMGAFWMANTRIPLTLAHIDQAGRVVSTVDMEPCADGVDCASYESAAPYRWALEVPLGGLAEFGLVDGAVLDPDSLPRAVE